MRVVVTGGAGFVGSCYVRTLLTGGYPGYEAVEVTVYDKLTYAGNLANLAPVASNSRLRFVQGDVTDGRQLDEVLPGCYAVVNFAAETHVDRSIRSGAEFVVTNTLGAQTLFEACLRAEVPRVVHVSTDEVYGPVAAGASTEDDLLRPSSPYAAAKGGGDLLAHAYAVTHGLPVVVTRCTNNYGPYQFPEKLIPLFVTNLLEERDVPLYGDGLQVRDWLHVADHCRGVQLALERGSPGEVYNIAGGVELTNRELAGRLVALCGADAAKVVHVEDRKGHDRRYALDDRKLRALGYAPAVPFDDGLAQTVRWYREHRDWWQPLKAKAALAGGG